MTEQATQPERGRIKACRNCGYPGYEWKMAFDATPVYNYLIANGHVYTVRPYYTSTLPGKAPKMQVHLHRDHKWTGHRAEKELKAVGSGRDALAKAMPEYLSESGFNTVDEWLGTLINMHGEKTTTMNWAIFKVILRMETA